MLTFLPLKATVPVAKFGHVCVGVGSDVGYVLPELVVPPVLLIPPLPLVVPPEPEVPPLPPDPVVPPLLVELPLLEQALKSNVQLELQARVPIGCALTVADAHVALFKLVPSQSSPGSTTPLLQVAGTGEPAPPVPLYAAPSGWLKASKAPRSVLEHANALRVRAEIPDHTNGRIPCGWEAVCRRGVG